MSGSPISRLAAALALLGACVAVLQLRLLRAARAILDPMLNLGQISRERAHDILTGDVVLSEAFAREELDRFNRLAFNDFIVAQGLLPPDLLAQAVETEFIPAQGPSHAQGPRGAPSP
jgi:HAMP domain-containing protein